MEEIGFHGSRKLIPLQTLVLAHRSELLGRSEVSVGGDQTTLISRARKGGGPKEGAAILFMSIKWNACQCKMQENLPIKHRIPRDHSLLYHLPLDETG